MMISKDWSFYSSTNMLIRLGAASLVFGLPALLYFFYFTCNDITGCPAPALLEPRSLSLKHLRDQTPWPEDGIWGFASWKASGWMMSYYLLSLVLYRVLPGQELYGTKLRESGRPLKYKLNGKLIITTCVKG